MLSSWKRECSKHAAIEAVEAVKTQSEDLMTGWEKGSQQCDQTAVLGSSFQNLAMEILEPFVGVIFYTVLFLSLLPKLLTQKGGREEAPTSNSITQMSQMAA